jgi:hypothetical protein
LGSELNFGRIEIENFGGDVLPDPAGGSFFVKPVAGSRVLQYRGQCMVPGAIDKYKLVDAVTFEQGQQMAEAVIAVRDEKIIPVEDIPEVVSGEVG